MWDLARGFCQRSLVCHSSVNSVRVSLDGGLAVSGHFDGTLRFWDLRTGKVANEVAGLHTQQITSVAVGLAAGSARAAGACCLTCELGFWNLISGGKLATEVAGLHTQQITSVGLAAGTPAPPGLVA